MAAVTKILVIGNGFDKAHGLKTGYADFIKWIRAIFKVYDEQKLGITVINSETKVAIEFEKQNPEYYREIIENRGNFWVAHFDRLEDRIGEKWLDFEREIESVTKRMYEALESDNRAIYIKSVLLKESSKNVEIPVLRTRAAVFEWLYIQLRQLVRLFEIYLCICVNGTITKEDRLEVITNIKPNKVLSFNYTTTYHDIYNFGISTDYIHGRAVISKKKEDCDLVLGFDDHYLDSAKTVEELVPFEKYYQRIAYRNSNEYFRWLEEKDSNGLIKGKEVYFYGHSLSPTDGDIIKLLIEGDNTRTIIFYRKDHEEDRANMIKNLAIILTPNGLIKRNGGISPVIEFRPI